MIGLCQSCLRVAGLSALTGWSTLLVVLLTASIQPVVAQDQLLPVYHFQRLDGYRETVTSRIVRDSLGLVWIGTENGLLRYDGYGFKEYRNDPGDPRSVSSSRIHSLLVDRKGRLWVGTMEHGLSLYDRSRDRFINFYRQPQDSTRTDQQTVYAILEDRHGTIWLATYQDGVVRVTLPADAPGEDLDSLARSILFREFSVGTPHNRAYNLCERYDGRILVASERGLVVINSETETISRPGITDSPGRSLDTMLVAYLSQMHDGTLWIGSATNGLYHLDWGRKTLSNYRHSRDDSLSIRSDEIWELTCDQHENLWVGAWLRR
jgi:ligand-binding sensor domain-containing protein